MSKDKDSVPQAQGMTPTAESASVSVTAEDLRHMRAVVRNFDHCCLERKSHFALVDIAAAYLAERAMQSRRAADIESCSSCIELRAENERQYERLLKEREVHALAISQLETENERMRKAIVHALPYVQLTSVREELKNALERSK